MPRIQRRDIPETLGLQSLHSVLQRVYAARGVTNIDELALPLKGLLPYQQMKGIDQAVAALIPVVTAGKRLLVVGDFDVDGATSTAVALRALHLMGAQNVDYLVPNRFDFGYGLSPELVAVAVTMKPDLIMTVDNGIASIDGVVAANAAGIAVVVTDHHLAAAELPDALAIVNPNQPGCQFASKAACGCTVVFYVMLALRAALDKSGWFSQGEVPNMAQLLDLVALASVADVVPLDRNNRILVEQGLRRIRAGQGHVGIQALLTVAGREPARIVASDFGFAIGPRLNAAGRLDDMSLGIECLLTDDINRALDIATQLDAFNRDRRSIEQGMQQEALALLAKFEVNDHNPVGVCLFQPDWHQGVIGILASRIKDKLFRPVIAFAADDNGVLKGSARSIPGLHIRDVIDEVDKRHPGLVKKFGGHAMAAGMTLNDGAFDAFSCAFDLVCQAHLSSEQLHQTIDSDGDLPVTEFTLELAEQLRWGGPWGQNFPEPVFDGHFRLVQQRIVGERHLKMVLQPEGSDLALDAIWFNIDPAQWPDQQRDCVHCVFQLDVNEFRGRLSLQLLICHLE